MMRRFSFLCALAALLLSARLARAEFLAVAVDTNLYPATISVDVTPTFNISNGFFFFSQSGTPNSLNIFETYTFSPPGGVTSPISVSLSGDPPFGVYRSFTEQHAFFLGTYEVVGIPDEEESDAAEVTTGLVAMLSQEAATDAIGNARTFEEVFVGYNEGEVIDALIAVGGGTGTDEQNSLLFSIASNTLSLQAAFEPVTNDLYNLNPAQLVAFSTATNGGRVSDGELIIGRLNPVPEPGTLTLCGLGALSLLVGGGRLRGKKA